MARTINGWGMYWTGVYFVDGLLIDSGPPKVRTDVERLFRELRVRACVTTHHYEDHSGNHAPARGTFRYRAVRPLARRSTPRRSRTAAHVSTARVGQSVAHYVAAIGRLH